MWHFKKEIYQCYPEELFVIIAFFLLVCFMTSWFIYLIGFSLNIQVNFYRDSGMLPSQVDLSRDLKKYKNYLAPNLVL